jgi:hypothetical protein
VYYVAVGGQSEMAHSIGARRAVINSVERAGGTTQKDRRRDDEAAESLRRTDGRLEEQWLRTCSQANQGSNILEGSQKSGG